MAVNHNISGIGPLQAVATVTLPPDLLEGQRSFGSLICNPSQSRAQAVTDVWYFVHTLSDDVTQPVGPDDGHEVFMTCPPKEKLHLGCCLW